MKQKNFKKQTGFLDYQEVIKEFERAKKAYKEREISNGVMYVLNDPEMRNYVENYYEGSHYNPEKEYIRKEAQILEHQYPCTTVYFMDEGESI